MPPENSALAPALPPSPLVDGYLPVAGSFDETRTPDGALRPHWEYLLGAIQSLGSAGIGERRREARRLIRDDGVTYNPYGDRRGFGRPWNLDLIPLLIRSDEWAEIERFAGNRMDPAELQTLADRIRAEPRRCIGKNWIPPSTSPSLVGGRIEPRPTVLRSFLVGGDDGYAVLPGGLSRVALSADTPLAASGLGGLAKDTWVLASEPERQESLVATSDQSTPAVAQQSEVSSRVADNLFWIGRHAERAEGLVRLLRVTVFKLSERASFAPGGEIASFVHPLLAALTRHTHKSLEVGIASEVEVTAPDKLDFAASSPWEQVVATLREGLSEESLNARVFSLPSPYVTREPGAVELALASFTPNRPILEATADLMGQIFREFEFDPTNDQVPGEQHITTALGRDFHDVTPIRGVFYGGGEHRLEVEVEVDVDRIPAPA